MKKLHVILIAVIAFLLGYLAGNALPLGSGSTAQKSAFSLPIFADQGIKGNAVVHVTLEMKDTANPLSNVEVDLAEKPGQPPVGGTALSDESGLAVFNVKPGTYSIFFNSNNFPKNLQMPETQEIEVKEGQINKAKILISLK